MFVVAIVGGVFLDVVVADVVSAETTMRNERWSNSSLWNILFVVVIVFCSFYHI